MRVLATFLFFCLFLHLHAQPYSYSKIQIDASLKDTFSFSKSWAYSWEVFKDETTGIFTRNDDQKLMPADTAHLFFTASCQTNVQGGYEIKYAYARKKGNEVILTLSDGLPAYASEFYFHIKADSFYFQPKTIYPFFISEQKFIFKIKCQKLILNKSNYMLNDKVIGFIDVEFEEIVSVPGRGIKTNVFFVKGNISTPLKNANNSGHF